MHVGFVGRGGLDAAVPGRVFASPHNRQIYQASRRVAVASGPHTSFATRQAAFDIAEGTVEYGIGIHGEPAQDSAQFPGLEPLFERMLSTLLDALPDDTDRVLLLVNGLGSTTALELGAITRLVDQVLGARRVVIDGALVGTYVSALTRCDQLAGDGDFGDNLLAGIENANRLDSPETGVVRLARSFLDTVGGSSGPLIGLVLDPSVADDCRGIVAALLAQANWT